MVANMGAFSDCNVMISPFNPECTMFVSMKRTFVCESNFIRLFRTTNAGSFVFPAAKYYFPDTTIQ
jgi:hypothetical protein